MSRDSNRLLSSLFNCLLPLLATYLAYCQLLIAPELASFISEKPTSSLL